MTPKQEIEVHEESTLKWPEGWQRTRIQDRRTQGSWKKSYIDYRRALVAELSRMGATSILQSSAEEDCTAKEFAGDV